MRSWRRVPGLSITLFSVLGVASGCHDRAWDFGVQVVAPDGGSGDAPKTDGATDKVTIDLTGFGGTGGAGGGGSGGGGTGGAPNQCDPNSPDRLTDISNCGECFHSCVVPN